MKLETAQSIGFRDVSLAQLQEAFRDDRGRGEYIILYQDPSTFMQAAGEDDSFALEYRGGDSEKHVRAAGGLSKAEVRRAFESYLSQDGRYLSEFVWEELPTKPWWKLW